MSGEIDSLASFQAYFSNTISNVPPNASLAKPSLNLIFKALKTINPGIQYLMAKQGITEATEKIIQGKPFIFNVVDETKAGGQHMVKILVTPKKSIAHIEVPTEPDGITGIKGGRNPTICHGLEIVVSAFKAANKPFPALIFGLHSDSFLTLNGDFYSGDKLNILIPLMFDPPNTNLLVFHTQVPHLNPEKLMRSWYKAYQTDENILNDPIRHTILLMPKSSSAAVSNPHFSSDQPKSKNFVHVQVLPTEYMQNRNRFKSLHLSRIKKWEHVLPLNATMEITVKPNGLRKKIILL